MKILAILLALTILFYPTSMAVETWGLLSKAQDDNETIEQAIDRLIAAHEDDSAAHLASGQSLEVHRAQEVLDAMPNSVLKDKIAYDRFTIDLVPDTIDPWTHNGFAEVLGIGDLEIDTAATTNSFKDLYLAAGDATEEQAQDTKLYRWLFFGRLVSGTDQTAYMTYGGIDIPTGIGFKVVNSTLYWYYVDNVSVEQLTQISGIDVTVLHLYEITRDDSDVFHVSVDGTEKGTIALSSAEDINGPYFFFRLKSSSGSSKQLVVRHVVYEAEYSN